MATIKKACAVVVHGGVGEPQTNACTPAVLALDRTTISLDGRRPAKGIGLFEKGIDGGWPRPAVPKPDLGQTHARSESQSR